MAISIIKQPDPVSLSRNQIEYQLETDNWITVVGSKTLFVIKITASPAVDDPFTIAWGVDPVANPDETVTMTCKAAPDDAGNQYIDNAGAIPLTDWVDLFLADLIKNFLFTRDFVLTKVTADASPAIQFRAREKGLKFSIEFTEALGWMIEFLNTDGIDQVFQTNMKQVLQVHVEDVYKSGNFELKHEEQRVPDSVKRSLFDIHEILDQFVELNPPIYNQVGVTRCDLLTKQYFVRYYERYGDTVTEQEVITGVTKAVMMAGTNFPFFNANTDFFTDYLVPSKAFLTWLPAEQDITVAQHQYLYFPIVSAATTSFKSKADIFYTDDTSDLDVEIGAAPGSEQYEIYIIPVGFSQVVQAVSDGGKTVDHYIIYITDQADAVVSELRTYYLDRKEYLSTAHVLYKNSIGGYDTLRVTGDLAFGLDVTKSVFETILPSTYDLMDPQFHEFNVSGREFIQMSTGHMKKADLIHLQELILSESIFQIDSVAYLPLTLDTKSITFTQTSADLYVMSFKVLPAYSKNSVSDE